MPFLIQRPLPIVAIVCKGHVAVPALAAFVGSITSLTVPAQERTPTQLEAVVITAPATTDADSAAPSRVLTGDELMLRRAGTLAETLKGQAGVSATQFGPNASRPVIRGLDGSRVKMLDNAGASFDASALSFDHAVPIDPLIVERVQVLRGPAALRFGGEAIGGAVNAINNRIPRERIDSFSGAGEVRWGGATNERGGAALLESGNAHAALHADVFDRATDDLRVPRFTPIEAGGPLPSTNRVRNSASRTSGGSLGGSLLLPGGYLGLNVDDYSSRYGTPAEAQVHIDMARRHVGVAGEWRPDGGLVAIVRGQAGHTGYEHREVEADGAVGTTFRASGQDGRVEAELVPVGGWRVTLGTQFERGRLSALGDEAFVPSTRTQASAAFALFDGSGWGGRWEAGLRGERVQIQSAGDADPSAPAQFGAPASREFWLTSASIGHRHPLGGGWAVMGTAGISERAPSAFELYANGLHAATGTFEVGDPGLREEHGQHAEAAVAWKSGRHDWRFGVFGARFARFIALDATGADATVNGESVPIHAFHAVRASLRGVEIEGRERLFSADSTLVATAKIDLTRGDNLDDDQPLPRMAPLRALWGLEAKRGPWSGRIEWDLAARQTRVPRGDVATPGYGLVNLSLMRRWAWGTREAVWFLRADNAGNTLAFNASTIRSVRELSPLAGRSIRMGLRVGF